MSSCPSVPSNYDVARSNLEHALGLPGSEGLDVEKCVRWVDEAARLVAQKTKGYFYQFKERPEEFGHSEGAFRMGWLVTLLQRDLGVRYRQDLVPVSDHDFLKRADHLFIHGIIQGKGGTCASLPSLYAAVGRRLGYPLRLVACKRHGFVRWDGRGERFNIEATAQGYLSHPDEHDLKWPFETTPEEVRRYKFLENETAEEEVAGFIWQRGHVLSHNGRLGDAAFEYLRAYLWAPGQETIVQAMAAAIRCWGNELRSRMGRWVPGLTVCQAPLLHPDLPEALRNDLNYFNVLEMMLDRPVWKRLWWETLRTSSWDRPPGMPNWFQATYMPPPAGGVKFEPCAPPESERIRVMLHSPADSRGYHRFID